MRQKIYSEIESIVPIDALEATHRADALSWVMSGAELCRLAKPATPPRHLVSYFAVIHGQSILLVDHKNAQLWLPSGGHVESGEHPRETVTRELFEELGFEAAHAINAPLMITSSETVGLTSGHTDVSLWYLVHANRDQVLRYDEAEFNGVRWFDFSELPYARSDPHLRRFVEKIKAAKSATHSQQNA
jgi:8-oxo-dGTP pyrophosphatase MutT (NUDIX family)